MFTPDGIMAFGGQARFEGRDKIIAALSAGAQSSLLPEPRLSTALLPSPGVEPSGEKNEVSTGGYTTLASRL